jgi:hypothetical protein
MFMQRYCMTLGYLCQPLEQEQEVRYSKDWPWGSADRALEPRTWFTTTIEHSLASIGDVFRQYVVLQEKLQAVATENSPLARDLLSALRRRFDMRLDLRPIVSGGPEANEYWHKCR